MALFRRQPEEAERILLQSSPPLVHRAIKLNLSLYKWSRALDLAIKYRSHVDTVLGYRQRHLDEFNKQEKNAKFLQYAAEVRTFLFLLYFYFLWQWLFFLSTMWAHFIFLNLFFYLARWDLSWSKWKRFLLLMITLYTWCCYYIDDDDCSLCVLFIFSFISFILLFFIIFSMYFYFFWIFIYFFVFFYFLRSL